MRHAAQKNAALASQPSPTPSTSGAPIPIDPYRLLPTSMRKPTLTFSSSSTKPTVPNLLSLPPLAYSSRLAGKQLLLEDHNPSTSYIGKGKRKANQCRIDPEEKRLREEEKDRAKKRKTTGVWGKGEAKRRKIWEIKAGDKLDYESLLPLHHLHLSYLSELLPLPAPPPAGTAPDLSRLPAGLNADGIAGKLVKADFTGAMITVRRAKNECLVGIKGIVVQETAETFKLVSEDCVIRAVPKKNSLLTLTFPAYSFPPFSPTPLPTSPTPSPKEIQQSLLQTPHIALDILASTIAYRAGERAGRRFKPGQGGGGWGEGWVGGLEDLGV